MEQILASKQTKNPVFIALFNLGDVIEFYCLYKRFE